MVLSYHAHSVSSALLDLFPNIGLEPAKFQTYGKFYTSSTNRRKFFENFATKHGFNPLVPKDWYNYPRKRIIATQVLY